MKIIIASDTHGSKYYVNKLLARFNEENAQKLFLLGDVLYHGPRNDLPKDYAPKSVIAAFNSIKEKIVCVRGNCDAEVDEMVLDFPLRSKRTLIVEGTRFILTHGHKYNDQTPPPQVKKGDIVLFGHSHIPFDEIKNGVRFINPGSVSIPKGNSTHSFVIYRDGKFTFETLD